jgi:hypothetical protein
VLLGSPAREGASLTAAKSGRSDIPRRYPSMVVIVEQFGCERWWASDLAQALSVSTFMRESLETKDRDFMTGKDSCSEEQGGTLPILKWNTP